MSNYPTSVRCFFCSETDHLKLYLRRYVSGCVSACPGRGSYHNAKVFVDIAESPANDYIPVFEWAADDPRWPVKCEHCDYEFSDEDTRQVFSERIYVRSDNGQEITWADRVPGMMRDAWWYGRKGPDGRALMVVLPNGREWFIDGRASNCELPNDSKHRCWVRTGEVPDITAGKNGPTCAAGAGSILADDYHGFLRNGVFDP